jgi:hypothetical protein
MGKSKVKNEASLVFFSGTITRDGVTVPIESIEYRRVELEDGTVEERGLPAGLQPGASIGEILATAFATPFAQPAGTKRRKRVASKVINKLPGKA